MQWPWAELPMAVLKDRWSYEAETWMRLRSNIDLSCIQVSALQLMCFRSAAKCRVTYTALECHHLLEENADKIRNAKAR